MTDPTKPGPQDVREALELARPYVEYLAGLSFPVRTSEVLAKIDAALAQSDAKPETDHRVVSWTNPKYRDAQTTYSIGPPNPVESYGTTQWQSDAEPVGWQTRSKGSPHWYIWQRGGEPDIDSKFYEARPLYTAPPRPDASGLLEAAEMAHEKAMGMLDGKSAAELFELEDELRARAADRSGK